jgi:hypothetical protein
MIGWDNIRLGKMKDRNGRMEVGIVNGMDGM